MIGMLVEDSNSKRFGAWEKTQGNPMSERRSVLMTLIEMTLIERGAVIPPPPGNRLNRWGDVLSLVA
jgi:hypothetical protein